MIDGIADVTGPDSVMVRASASGTGGRGFDPGPRYTKDAKNGTMYQWLPCLALSIHTWQTLASLLPLLGVRTRCADKSTAEHIYTYEHGAK